MIRSTFEFRTVPFSARLIKDHRLHIVDEDELGGSSILIALDDPKVRKPERMALCFSEGVPVGVGIVFVCQPGDNWLLAYEDLRDWLVHGFLNVYVTSHVRRQGIGKALLDMAVKDFHRTYPLIPRVMVSRILHGKFGKYEGVEPVYAKIGTEGAVMLLHRVMRRDPVGRRTSIQDHRAFFGRPFNP